MSRFPMFRLLTLLARQVTSPVASRIKGFAVANEWFRRRVCMTLGRSYHSAQLRVRLWSLALPQPRTLPPLSDSAALESGASLIGETIVFVLGSIILLSEMNRQGNIQENKELDAQSQWAAILLQLEEIEREVALQQQDLERLLAELRRRAPSKFGPPTPRSPDTTSAPHSPAAPGGPDSPAAPGGPDSPSAHTKPPCRCDCDCNAP